MCCIIIKHHRLRRMRKEKEDNIYTIEFNKDIESYLKEKGKVPLPAYMDNDKIKNEINEKSFIYFIRCLNIIYVFK